MWSKKKRFQPGDKVCLKQNAYTKVEERYESYLIGTEGSVGTIVSFDEYTPRK